MRLSNKISYLLGCVECFLFAGSVFGWAFLEFIMKDEGVFMNLCEGNESHTSDQCDTTVNENNKTELVFCNEALQEYVNVFSWMLIRN